MKQVLQYVAKKQKMEMQITDDTVDSVISIIDKDKDGKISKP